MSKLSAGSLLLVVVTACTAKLSSTATLDGQPFTPTECRNGSALGFVGVELRDAQNRKVRLVSQPDGQAQAYVFAANATKGALIGMCGPLALETQKSTVNKVKNIEGKATLSCTAKEGALTGEITFANCH